MASEEQQLKKALMIDFDAGDSYIKMEGINSMIEACAADWKNACQKTNELRVALEEAGDDGREQIQKQLEVMISEENSCRTRLLQEQNKLSEWRENRLEKMAELIGQVDGELKTIRMNMGGSVIRFEEKAIEDKLKHQTLILQHLSVVLGKSFGQELEWIKNKIFENN